MRIGAQALLRLLNADQMQQLQDAFTSLGGIHVLVQGQHLADLALDHVQGVERGHRLLKNHRDIVAPRHV